jgi:signal recognition particle subunit SRP54
MLETISKGFIQARNALQGKITVDEASILSTIQVIRNSLLDADVEISVVGRFIENVKSKALGEVLQFRVKHRDKMFRLTPGDYFVKICQDELEHFLGKEEAPLRFNPLSATRFMLVGLQGCGKTTTCAKLANYLLEQGKSPLLVAADTYRPAAAEQLQILGERLNVVVYREANASPLQICQNSLAFAQMQGKNAIIFDTAGRLAIDMEMMDELKAIYQATKPDNILMVVDAMIGQDAVQTASRFNQILPVDGFILSKMDGDARGGAAFSLREITGKPIHFLGMGEGVSQLEKFRAEGIASRILGMGDVVGLVQDFEKVVDEKRAEEDAKKLLKGKFTLVDFVEQIKMIKKMGPLQSVFEKFPGASEMLPAGAVLSDKELVKVESIIQSMTPAERMAPEIIMQNHSRQQRIASGCGRSRNDVSGLLNRFLGMKKIMSQMDTGFLGKIPGLGSLSKLKNLKNLDLSQLMPTRRGGTNTPTIHFSTQEEREKLKNKRKREKKARKQGRK